MIVTMKHKVAELEGALLDAAVALADGHDVRLVGNGGPEVSFWAVGRRKRCNQYATDWEHGGRIIERERIGIEFQPRDGVWVAFCFSYIDGILLEQLGPTLLIAAMRAYVAAKFGDEVELP